MRCACVCVLVVFLAGGLADDVEVTLQSGLMLKMLRDMANQTEANSSLNLPANASSIRENITDTFSCENKTYGYYADVDNDCQLFHVCLPSQTPAGRNVTYKWSFICPNETVFNQEVLVCTRPADSIPCEDSPNYYDLNMEIGKTHNQTRKTVDSKETPNKIQRRKPDRKQVLLEKLMEEIAYENIDDKIPEQNSEDFEQIIPLVDVGEAELNTMIQGSENTGNFAEAFENSNNFEQIFPVTVEKAVNNMAVSNVYKTDVGTVDKTVPNDKITVDKTEIEMTEIKKDVPESALEKENEERLAMERSMGKKYNKGYFRFRADI